MGIQCINGEWVPESQSLKLVPDCERNYLFKSLNASCRSELYVSQQPVNLHAETVALACPIMSVNAQKIFEGLNVSGEQTVVQLES